ncbi:MAG TPA: TlpA disulfide reductase family protein [Pyrinomonadaceae bacterium]|nr:TlpA disulfide reductase family protein [Pyrinomonadaceae bacterium]
MKLFIAALTLQFAFVAAATAQGGAVRLEGQVVCCEECWAEADRTRVAFGTAEDLLKARSCVEGGDPTLLAVREGERFTLYRLEAGKFRLPGKNWLEFVGRRVAVSGAVRKKGEALSVRVDALEVLAPSLAEQEAARVVGTEVELAAADLSGVGQRLSALRGRVVVLNFWATYCGPCRAEMPDLAAVQNDYAALGVQVVGASVDAPEDRAKVLQFVKELKLNFPIWTGVGLEDMTRFGVGGALPATVVVGRDGRVVKIISGVVRPKELRQQLDTMLVAAEAEGGRETGGRAAPAKTSPREASSVPS